MGNTTQKTKFYKSNWFMWIMLFFITPIGIVLLWTKKDLKFTKKTKGIITAIFSIFFILIITGNNSTDEPIDNSTQANAQQSIEEEKPEQEELEQEEPEEEIVKTFEELVEEYTIKSVGKDDFIRLEYDDDAQKEISIYVKLSDNLTNNLTVNGMLLDATKTLEELSKIEHFTTLEHVSIIHEAEFIDTLGNTKTANADIISIPVSTVMQINWENFLFENLPDICETYYLHPSFK